MGFVQRCFSSSHNKILMLIPIVMICLFMFGCSDDDDDDYENENPFLNVADDLAGSTWVNSADSTDTLYFLLEPYEQSEIPGALVNARRMIYEQYHYELFVEIIDENHIDVDFLTEVIRGTYGWFYGYPPEDQVMNFNINDSLDQFTISGFTGSLGTSRWEDITFKKIAN